MKTLPFPFPLNIGTDIVHIPRIHRLITSRARTTKSTITSLDRFTRRILREEEQRHFRSRFPVLQSLQTQPQTQSPNPLPVDTHALARWLAGRFAAKEAARKAAPGGAVSVGWKDVMVRIDAEARGRPEVVYVREGKEGAVGRVGRLSISHDGEYVVATVLAAGEVGGMV